MAPGCVDRRTDGDGSVLPLWDGCERGAAPMLEERSYDRPVRRAYLVVLVGVLLAVVTLWITVGTTDGFRRVAFPTVVVVHGVLVAGILTRRLPLAIVGGWLVGSMAALLFGRLLSWEAELVARPERLGESVVAVLSWFGIVFALSFLAFGTRRGAVVSLSGFVLLYLAVGASLSRGMLAETHLSGLIVFAPVGHATLIAVVWVLARNTEQLAAARATAELMELQLRTDPLTGVANRRRLDDELGRLLAQARRYDQPFSVVLIDLDRFKAVNDSHGHEVGDRVLIETVDRLQAVIRDADLLGRWGGEEFLLLAPSTSHVAACSLAERCRRAIAGAPTRQAGVTVTASLGVATLGADDDVRSLLRRADLAMYTAKSEGRDRVVGLPGFDVPDGAGATGLSNEAPGPA